MERKQCTNIDEYISMFPEQVQRLLQQVRAAIRKAAPEATEKISYGIPTFYLSGNLVHFGAYKNHIGFYPSPAGLNVFKKELAIYKGSKGSVHFPLDMPIPVDLIKKIVTIRVGQNLEKIRKV